MAVQPQRRAVGGFAIGWRFIFIVIAVILFVIATFVALGDVSTKWQAALIPLGLAFFAAAHA